MRLTAMAAVLALVLAACGLVPGAPAPAAGTLTIATNAEIESTHPFLAHQIAGISARMNMFDTLVEYDYEGRLVPGLAESWTVDGLTIEFKLRQGIRFHNGEEVDAESVKFTFEHLTSEELNSPTAANVRAVEEVRVIDDYTVQIILSQVDARIFDVLANNISILPPGYYAEVGLQGFNDHPIGTGPFKFVEWVKDERLVMEANEDYWEGSYKGQPRVKTLIFRPITTPATRVAELRAGSVDIAVEIPPDQVEPLRADGFQVMESKSPQVTFVYFYPSRPDGQVLSDARVRQAMNYAVDVDTIIRTVLRGFGRPTLGGLSDLVMGYDPDVEPFEYDPDRARQLLAEAGYANGFELVLDISTSDRIDVAEAVVAQLADVGIRVTLNPMPSAVKNERWVARELSALHMSSWFTYTDPALLDLLAGCNGFLANFCSEEAQPHLDVGGSTLDPAEREPAYRQATAAFTRDPFAIYLHAASALTGMSANVKDWTPHGVTYIIGTRVRVE